MENRSQRIADRSKRIWPRTDNVGGQSISLPLFLSLFLGKYGARGMREAKIGNTIFHSAGRTSVMRAAVWPVKKLQSIWWIRVDLPLIEINAVANPSSFSNGKPRVDGIIAVGIRCNALVHVFNCGRGER